MSEPERIPSLPHSVSVRGVDVFRWLPRRFAALPDYQPENFGDSLALDLVTAIVAKQRIQHVPARSNRLLSVGSVLHFARSHDVVWGTGVNGKVPGQRIGAGTLDVRAVRGPKTRELLQLRDIPTPEVYGDPGLLLPHVFPGTRGWAQRKRRKLAVIPNFNDARTFATHPDFVNPLGSLWGVVRTIAESEFVIASSLHGIVIAEALGVPVRPLVSETESSFKYDDYALGTGREPLPTSETLESAIAAGPIDPLEWDPAPLLRAFPADLWHGSRNSHAIIAGSDADALAATLANVAEHVSEHDEVLIGLTTSEPSVLETARRAALADARLRVRSLRDLTCGGTPWDFMLTWATGSTIGLLPAGSTYRESIVTSAATTLAESTALGVFGRDVVFERGPDDDRWRAHERFDPSLPVERSPRLTTLPEHPEMLALGEFGGGILATDRLEALGGMGRGDFPLLGALASAYERGTPTLTVAELTGFTARPEPCALDTTGLTTLLQRYTEAVRALPSTALDAVAAELCAAVNRAIRNTHAVVTEHDLSAQPAALKLVHALAPSLDREDALPLVAIALGLPQLVSFTDEADTAAVEQAHVEGSSPQDTPALPPRTVLSTVLDTLATGLLVSENDSDSAAPRGLADVLNELPSASSTLVAAALRTVLPGMLAVATAAELSSLRRIALAVRADAAGANSDVEFALASVADTAVVIEHAVPTGAGFLVTGTMPLVFEGTKLQVWVSDAGSGTAARVGTLTAGKPTGGRLTFAGHVRHAFAPAGKLSLSARRGGVSVGMHTVRTPARKVAWQLLHPVEIPLDGGTALLVRRPSPVSALRARLGH